MSQRLALAFVALMLVGFPARSQDEDTSDQPHSLPEAQAEFQDADDELNSVWHRCINPEAATVQAIAQLKESQKQWMLVRDMTARAFQLGESSRRPQDDEYYYHGLAVMTRSRSDELRTLFGCD